jgi:hypothetical protein
MRNVDSKIKSPQFDRYVYSFHRSFAATFSTASTHSGSSTTSQRYKLAAPARMVAQRADDLGCRLAQVAQVISGKFLGRECRLDPENIHRTVDARAIQQRDGNRCQSIVYRRISIGSAAERGIAGAVSSLSGLRQNPIEPFLVTCESILRFFRFAELFPALCANRMRDRLAPRRSGAN